MAEDTGLSVSDVLQVAGITYRQLDYWVRTGLVPLDNPTPGSGRPRRFDEAAVERIVEIANLRRQLKTLEQQVRGSRREQRLPETVSDSDVVTRVAAMIGRAGS